jgi:Ca-activated chloride channel family protein
VYSPSHELTVTRSDARSASLAYEEADVRPALDFVLYYAASPAALGTSLLTYHAPGDDGFFLLIVTPPDLGEAPALAKDLVLVLDRSGSMSGEKIEQAKRALRYVVENLNPEDRFAVLAFSDTTRALYPSLVAASPQSVAEARAWIDAASASGGTNLDLALTQALGLFGDSERPGFLVFLTDGEPTVGETDSVRIATHAVIANKARPGVGYDVNATLLDQRNREPWHDDVRRPGRTPRPLLVLPQDRVPSLRRHRRHRRRQDLRCLARVLPDLFSGTQLPAWAVFRGAATRRSPPPDGPSAARTYEFCHPALSEPTLPRVWAGRRMPAARPDPPLWRERRTCRRNHLAQSAVRHHPGTSFLVEEGDLSDEAAAVPSTAPPPRHRSGAVQAATVLKNLAEASGPGDPQAVRVVSDRVTKDGVDRQPHAGETLDIRLQRRVFRPPGLLPWIARSRSAIGSSCASETSTCESLRKG